VIGLKLEYEIVECYKKLFYESVCNRLFSSCIISNGVKEHTVLL
jgi:hypothetical protein